MGRRPGRAEGRADGDKRRPMPPGQGSSHGRKMQHRIYGVAQTQCSQELPRRGARTSRPSDCQWRPSPISDKTVGYTPPLKSPRQVTVGYTGALFGLSATTSNDENIQESRLWKAPQSQSMNYQSHIIIAEQGHYNPKSLPFGKRNRRANGLFLRGAIWDCSALVPQA